MKDKKKFKIKNLFKSRIFFFVLGIFLTSIISVSAASLLYSSDVTYDNSSSGMSATTVQDALDELNEKAKSAPSCDSEGNYTVNCPSGTLYMLNDITYKCLQLPVKDKNIATRGDGLYIDTYETGRYVYKGASPNNYITFSGDTWRILAVETDGTLKIMKQDSIGRIKYDSDVTFVWSSATLNTYLNGTYYNTLDSTYIQKHSFNVGNVSGNGDLTTTRNEEKAITWTGNIALANVSDYIKSNTNTSSCGSISSYNSNASICKTSSFIGTTMTSSNLWLLSLYPADPTLNAWLVSSNGGIYNDYVNYPCGGVHPVLFLKSDITLSGSGTEYDPYAIN